MKLTLARRDDAFRRLPDAGPSSIRYLAVLAGAIFAVLAVGAVAPTAGHGVRDRFCGRSDTGCAAHAIATDDLGVCRVLSHADAVTDDAVVFTDDLGRSGRLTLSRSVDKNAVVHWFVRQDGVSGDDADRPGADVAVGGQVTELASEDAAREYITAAQHEPVRARLAAADPTGLVPRLADRIDGHQVVSRPPDAYYVAGGDALELGNEARSGVNGRLVAGGTAGVAEVRFSNTVPPVTTLFVRLSTSATTALGLQPDDLTGLTMVTGLGIAGIRYDETGRPDQLVIEAAGQLPGRLGPPFGKAGPALMAGLVAPGPAGTDGHFTGRVTMTLDLTDEPTATVAADALHALGVPLLLDQGSPQAPPAPPERAGRAAAARGPVQRLYRLLDQGAAGTSVTVNTYRPSTSPDYAGGVTLGLQGGLTIAGALPAADYYYAPGQGFVQWQTCG